MIGDFFRNLFGKNTPTPNPVPDPKPNPEPPVVDPPVEEEEEEGLSDASDITDLDSITVSNPDTLIVIDGPDEPLPDPNEETEEPQPVSQRYMWCLDNGHGKKTAGKNSPVFDDGETQFFEYEFNRDVVERIIEKLQEAGVAYADLMPDVENIGNDLEERVKRANEWQTDLPKLFISIHSNAAPADDTGWTLGAVILPRSASR